MLKLDKKDKHSQNISFPFWPSLALGRCECALWNKDLRERRDARPARSADGFCVHSRSFPTAIPYWPIVSLSNQVSRTWQISETSCCFHDDSHSFVIAFWLMWNQFNCPQIQLRLRCLCWKNTGTKSAPLLWAVCPRSGLFPFYVKVSILGYNFLIFRF